MSTSEKANGIVPARFAAFCLLMAGWVPRRLSGLVTDRVIGFALINGFTFGVDLLILTALRGGLKWPVGVAITVGYVCAFSLSFWLNRWLNFRSHAAVGSQIVRYCLVVAVNYTLIILGIGAGLAAVGVPYQLGRVIAGACEAVFMFCAMRWVVFPRRTAPEPAAEPLP